MKTLPARFINAIVLSILFFLTTLSLIGVEQDAATAWTDIHIWAGSLMLLGSIIHLVTNLDWVRTVFSRPSQSLNQKTRRNKRTDLGLFITGSICTLTGSLWLFEPLERLNRLHTISGLFMLLLMFMHLALHWQWLVHTIGRLFGGKARASATVPAEH